MSMTIALLCLLCLLLALLLLRPSTAVSTPNLIPASPLQSRQVSFSDTSCPLPITPSPLPAQRRWSSPLHKRTPSTPEPTRPPRFGIPQNHPATSVDQFGRTLPSSPMFSRRISTPLRLSLTSRRRSATTSCTSTSVQLDPVDTRAYSLLSSMPATQPSQKRIGFVNPFGKHSRSRTLSPPSTFKSPDASNLSTPSSPPPPRQTFVHKFKSIFKSKSIPPDPSPVVHSQPILATIHTKLRRKPVMRTQPYGPPWNAPMPVPDCALPQHPLQKPAQTSFPRQIIRKRSLDQCSRPEITSTSPVRLSPRTFISELDEKLMLLQQQCIQESRASLNG